MATKKPKTPPATYMGQFLERAQANPAVALQLLLWKQRHQNPDMSVTITEADVQAFQACVDYLEVEPVIKMFQPGGLPERPGFTKKDGTQMPARPAVPPREECVVQLTDKNGNAITPIEQSTEEQAKSRQARAVQDARAKAPGLVADLNQMLARGETSTALFQEATSALLTLARGT